MRTVTTNSGADETIDLRRYRDRNDPAPVRVCSCCVDSARSSMRFAGRSRYAGFDAASWRRSSLFLWDRHHTPEHGRRSPGNGSLGMPAAKPNGRGGGGKHLSQRTKMNHVPAYRLLHACLHAARWPQRPYPIALTQESSMTPAASRLRMARNRRGRRLKNGGQRDGHTPPDTIGSTTCCRDTTSCALARPDLPIAALPR